MNSALSIVSKAFHGRLARQGFLFAPVICAALFVCCPFVCGQQLFPFQGRLTDGSGRPISDGARLIQFQIYSEPSGGSVLWAGELHRATINGGLVNVVLGSKNPLPNDRLDQPDRSFFDQPLYLQITVDANADNQITAADPPLLPRQTILPVLFAGESANARKLQGYDWSALFGTNTPSGKIDGARIANITSNQIALGTINATLMAPGSVGSGQVATAAITAAHIATNSLTQALLAPRRFDTNVHTVDFVEVGNIAVSASSGSFGTTSTTFQDVLGLAVRLRTAGRPVALAFRPADAGLNDIVCFPNTTGYIRLLRNGSPIYTYQCFSASLMILPASTISTLIDALPGEWEFRVQAAVDRTDTAGFHIRNIQLIAYEL